ncbi:hypothetical protein BTJ68_15090 [Hortaea werneckii EXF-2000]|uniref:AN1-type domain-containing protein n=1 Tax=Hortaea werneckii EXF-2000 TaxID=1157616 RepID=A0A1Z5SLW8_HORWE|nr:hypothetical protein BTJ68_15090 [Hortaea werneckii EXF-2000]
MPTKAPCCSFTGCKKPSQRIFGDCSACTSQFCASHRIPEDHSCTSLQTIRDQAKASNTAKLESERTSPVKNVI